MNLNRYTAILALICTVTIPACVERTIAVRTTPPGALVTVNDVEQGRTPVTFPFTWYGDYRVRLELPAYETLSTTRQVDPPPFQWPVLDFICEILLPFKFHDQHEWNFTMAPRPKVPPNELIDQAQEFRQEARPPAE